MRVREPVFYSPQIAPAVNQSPGTLIIGAPGGGKSFLAFTLTCQLVMQGTWTIMIDPKSDAIPIASMKGMGKINHIDLQTGMSGILSPFAMSDDVAESKMYAMETIKMLNGGSLSAEAQTKVFPVLSRVAAEPRPSLTKVYEYLILDGDPHAVALGETLKLMSELPFGRLCFSPAGEEINRIRPEDGLTIITMLGIELPSSIHTPREQYTYAQLLGVTVMYLLTAYTTRLLYGDGTEKHKTHPKAIIIDEAWNILSSESGKQVVDKILRLGRRFFTSVILVSQNPADFQDESIRNALTTVFAFKMESRQEAIGVVKDLLAIEGERGEEINEDAVNMMLNLGTGECLMRDRTRRATRVQIDNWNSTWFEAFDTNPMKKEKPSVA